MKHTKLHLFRPFPSAGIQLIQVAMGMVVWVMGHDQVVGGVYGVLIRTSMSRARLEVSKTRDFVRYVPVHVLTRLHPHSDECHHT
jgi:hypothetical protein